MNGCYKVVNRNLQWAAAGLECRSLHPDAHLLVINDAVEQTEVARMLASIRRQFALLYFNQLYNINVNYRCIPRHAAWSQLHPQEFRGPAQDFRGPVRFCRALTPNCTLLTLKNLVQQVYH